jgi:hypothetical protein
MENLILPVIAMLFITVILFVLRQIAVAKKRTKIIDQFNFPDKVSQQLIEKYPHLTNKQVKLVITGLREYFHICNMAGKQSVSMPSQAVDVVWHEFILFTKMYERFCNKAFGRFLHHTPAEAMQSKKLAQEGIKLAWKLSCKRENIDPHSPSRLPLLFAIDAQLAIPDGFKYSRNCNKNDDYCASHIGCTSSGCSSCSSDSCSSGCGGD